MKSIILSTLSSLCAILLMACGGSDNNPSPPTSKAAPSPLDTSSFIAISEDNSCAELQNRLFIIDQQYVLSEKLGNCADARYRQILYGKTPNDIICSNIDSIAGPRFSCKDANLTELFKQAIANLAVPDLGLGTNHQVQQVALNSNTETTLPLESLAARTFYSQAPLNVVIRDERLWDQMSKLGGIIAPSISKLDFSQQMLFGVFAKAPGNCKEVNIHRAASSGQKVLVQFSEKNIVTNCDVSTTVFSTAMNLVAGPSLTLPVEFIDVSSAMLNTDLVTQTHSSNIRTPRTIVIRDQAAWSKLWLEHAGDQQAVPVIDFSKKTVIGIFSGSKPNGCYGFSDVKAYRDKTRIIVTVRESGPSPLALCAMYIPSPAYIMTIDKTNEPVEFTTISFKN